MLIVKGDKWGFSWQSKMLVVRGRGGVFKAVPDAACGGKAFSWPSHTLVVGGRGVGSHGSPRHGCGWERRGFSWQFHTLVVWGQPGVLRCWL